MLKLIGKKIFTTIKFFVYLNLWLQSWFFVVSGKSTLLAALDSRELPIPEHIDIFLLRREMPPSDKTAIQCVIEVDQERIRLEKEAEILATKEDIGKTK